MAQEIDTSAEAAENAAIPQCHEVHCDPDTAPPQADLPEGMRGPVGDKTPAKWAYERLILYIRNFEEQLDGDHEVAMGFAGGDLGVLKIEGLGYFDPDIVTFYGRGTDGARTQLIQHVSQLNVMLKAWPKDPGAVEPNRIGFRLAADLDRVQTAPD